ncbi:MAG: hypothetical protein IJ809_00065 [Clostridia bacterium]|nr:hypothetical protein [Clostridia bacterium]
MQYDNAFAEKLSDIYDEASNLKKRVISNISYHYDISQEQYDIYFRTLFSNNIDTYYLHDAEDDEWYLYFMFTINEE